MSDLQVQPLDESGRPPDQAATGTVSFGRGGSGLAGWLRAHPRLRALRQRPPASAVAVVSALIGAAAVAVYMDRPVEIVAGDPSPRQLNAAPESWLNVTVDDNRQPGGEDLERMLARHPAEATVTVPVDLNRENLAALPPGTYRVAASCSAETVSLPDQDGPAWFSLDIMDPVTFQPAPDSSTGRDPDALVCDGEPHTLSTGMAVADYQAFTLSYTTEFDVQGMPAVTEGVMLAVSFTPVR